MFELLTFLSIFIGGLLLACWYGRKTKRFRWSEYIALFLLPSLFLIWLIFNHGLVVLMFCLGTAVLGTLFEGLIGWAYHKTIASKFWEYKRLPIFGQGYTSWLALPFWGFVGVVFFLLMKVFGLWLWAGCDLMVKIDPSLGRFLVDNLVVFCYFGVLN